jgi:hypothetical protein
MRIGHRQAHGADAKLCDAWVVGHALFFRLKAEATRCAQWRVVRAAAVSLGEMRGFRLQAEDLDSEREP